MPRAERVVVSFEGNFDTSPDPDHYNRIPGRQLAYWLAERLNKAGLEAEEPDPEDFGWFVVFRFEGKRYWLLLTTPLPRWMVFVHRAALFESLWPVPQSLVLKIDDLLRKSRRVKGIRWHREGDATAEVNTDSGAKRP